MITGSDILNASILIVGAQDGDVRALEGTLAGAGYSRVATSTSLTAAGELQRTHHYDLVVVDMPADGAAGFEAIEGLKTLDGSDSPTVLAITARPEQRLRALKAGAKDFVAKPAESLEILTRIHNMLEVRLLNIEARNHGRVLEQLVQDLQEQAVTDPLTGLLNRRFLQEFLPREVMKAHRHGTSLAVIMVDLDFFKRINDVFGHEAGDLVLRKVAGTIKGTFRGSDVACRYGGEEFVLILPGATLEGARQKAETIRLSIASLDLMQRDRSLGRVTASLGVALYPEHGADADALVRAADAALYAAKEGGRNRVVVAAADESGPRKSVRLPFKRASADAELNITKGRSPA